MASKNTTRMKVECRDCRFSQEIGPDDEKLPGEVVIEHGRDTGHKLDVSPVED